MTEREWIRLKTAIRLMPGKVEVRYRPETMTYTVHELSEPNKAKPTSYNY